MHSLMACNILLFRAKFPQARNQSGKQKLPTELLTSSQFISFHRATPLSQVCHPSCPPLGQVTHPLQGPFLSLEGKVKHLSVYLPNLTLAVVVMPV